MSLLPSPCLLRVYAGLIKRMSYSILMRTDQPISSFCWHVNYLRSFCPPVLRRNSMFMTWAQSRYVFVAPFPDISYLEHSPTLIILDAAHTGILAFSPTLIHGDVNPSAPTRKNGGRKKLVDGSLGVRLPTTQYTISDWCYWYGPYSIGLSQIDY